MIHFLSNRHTPRGGPDGGNGGTGGSVLFRSSSSVSTLYSFRNQPRFTAEDGVGGARNGCHGARGEDLLVLVPVGTVIRDADSEEVLADLLVEGDEIIVAEGGEGGRGNGSFVTSRRQAPRICERGLSGEERTLRLELKLIADIGIMGYPNVGKSSLISSISRVRAKVADYPFTTLVPNLGVVDVDGKHQFVAVDIPGLIEGAHEGRGLGDRFLRHVERTRVLVHMVDIAALEGRDPLDDYQRIRKELSAFNPRLATRREVVVGNKADLLDEEEIATIVERFAGIGVELLPVSVATMSRIRELVARMYHALDEERQREVVSPATARRKVYRYRGEEGFRVERDEEGYTVTGNEVETLLRKLVLNSQDALEYLEDRLERMGVLKELRKQGFHAGDCVRIGDVELELER